jgi:hypothetical protein
MDNYIEVFNNIVNTFKEEQNLFKIEKQNLENDKKNFQKCLEIIDKKTTIKIRQNSKKYKHINIILIKYSKCRNIIKSSEHNNTYISIIIIDLIRYTVKLLFRVIKIMIFIYSFIVLLLLLLLLLLFISVNFFMIVDSNLKVFLKNIAPLLIELVKYNITHYVIKLLYLVMCDDY